MREPAHDTPRARPSQKIKTYPLFLRVDANNVRHVVTELAALAPPALAFGEVEADLLFRDERRRPSPFRRLQSLFQLYWCHKPIRLRRHRRLFSVRRPRPRRGSRNRFAAVLRRDRFLPSRTPMIPLLPLLLHHQPRPRRAGWLVARRHIDRADRRDE